MKILVADDDQNLRIIVGHLLEVWSHEFLLCGNGRQALDHLHRDRFDLAILDWEMPGLTGPQIIQRIKSEAIEWTPYFILLTARRSLKDKIDGLWAGADDYIRKPFEFQDLLVRLELGLKITNARKKITLENNPYQGSQ